MYVMLHLHATLCINRYNILLMDFMHSWFFRTSAVMQVRCYAWPIGVHVHVRNHFNLWGRI